LPFQYVVGIAHWRRVTLAVGSGVLCPRPETEQLVDLAAANHHTCGRDASGGVFCWGSDGDSQLGGPSGSTQPVRVSTGPGVPLAPAQLIAAGHEHTCALLAGGTVWCWGGNLGGQSGQTPSSTPLVYAQQVPGLSGVVSLAAGGDHSCALRGDGTVVCWGTNIFGELGNGTHTGGGVPVVVSNLSGVVAITAGAFFTCAIRGDGSVACWGSNAWGQLGDGSRSDATVPIPVAGITNATVITAGWGHTCARLADGTARCWGYSGDGQVGDGAIGQRPDGGFEYRATPVAVAGLTDVTAITAGAFHTCARTGDGDLWCWGYNASGALGDGTLINRPVPARVGGPRLDGVRALQAQPLESQVGRLFAAFFRRDPDQAQQLAQREDWFFWSTERGRLWLPLATAMVEMGAQKLPPTVWSR